MDWLFILFPGLFNKGPVRVGKEQKEASDTIWSAFDFMEEVKHIWD